MGSLQDVENRAWKEIKKATERMDARRIAHFSAIAQEIEERKRNWEARIAAGPSDQQVLASAPTPTNGARRRGRRHAVPDYTGRPIRAFEFDGNRFQVTTYKALLVQLANILRRKHSRDFDTKVLSFGGRKRRYFSQSPRELKYAHELESGGLYVETNLNANLIVGICFDMVRALGYSETRLRLFDFPMLDESLEEG
jgi:hypothetical protein